MWRWWGLEISFQKMEETTRKAADLLDVGGIQMRSSSRWTWTVWHPHEDDASWSRDSAQASAQPPFQPALPLPGQRRSHWDVTHACISGQRPFVHLLSGLTKEDSLCACASEDWKTPPEHFNETGGQFTLLSLQQSLMPWELYGQMYHFHMTAVNVKVSRNQRDGHSSMHP